MAADIDVRIALAKRYRNDRRWNYQGTIQPHNTVYFVIGGNVSVSFFKRNIGLTPTDYRRICQ